VQETERNTASSSFRAVASHVSKCEFFSLFLFFLSKWKYEFSLPEIKKEDQISSGAL